MKYLIYKTVNNINGHYYIGKHQTDNIYDSYLGSGVLLKKAIKKYGKENFAKEILHIFDNEEDMNTKEKEIVVVSEKETYNIAAGGYGGCIVLYPENPKYKETCQNISKSLLRQSKKLSNIAKTNHKTKSIGMYGKKQSDYQKQQAKIANTNKVVSAETRKKLHNVHKGRKCPWISESNKRRAGGPYKPRPWVSEMNKLRKGKKYKVSHE